MSKTYCGLSFAEAHAIFKQDSWFANPADRYLQIINKDNDICATKKNNPTDGYEHVSKTAAFATEEARAALTEIDLQDKQNLLSFMFSVSLNKEPLAYIKTNFAEITRNLGELSEEDKNTYKRYVGHLAWFKTTWDPTNDPLTMELFKKLGKSISKDDTDVTLSVDSKYYLVFKEFVPTVSEDDKLSNGLKMDLDRFNNFYAAVSKSQQKGGRKTKRSRTQKKKTNGKRKTTQKCRK